MRSPDHRVRAAAIRVLYHWHDAPAALEQAVADPHPRVRREAVTVLGQLASAEAARIAMKVLDHPTDEFLDFALRRTCRLLESHWLPAFQRNEFNFDGNGNADRLAFALKAIEKPEVLAPLVQMLNDGAQDADPAIVRLVGKIGSAEDLNTVVRIAVTTDEQRLQQTAALALLEAAEDRGITPADPSQNAAACRKLLATDDIATIVVACRLVGLWKLEELTDELTKLITGDKRSVQFEILRAASRSLADLGNREFLMATAEDTRRQLAERTSVAAALVRIDPVAGAESVASLLSQSLTETLIDNVIGAVLVKKSAAEALASALKGLTIPEATAVRALQLVETSGNRVPALAAALESASGLKPVSQLLEPSRMRALHSAADRGDAVRGKEIYNRAALACVACHVVNGQGGTIGPDLSSIGASAPLDYLLESIIEPSKKIKEGYRMSILTKNSGDVVAGAIVQEGENVVVVRDPAGNEIRVPKSSIKARETSLFSMMPSGLTASLSEGEFLDLLRYLSSLGKQQGTGSE